MTIALALLSVFGTVWHIITGIHFACGCLGGIVAWRKGYEGFWFQVWTVFFVGYAAPFQAMTLPTLRELPDAGKGAG